MQVPALFTDRSCTKDALGSCPADGKPAKGVAQNLCTRKQHAFSQSASITAIKDCANGVHLRRFNLYSTLSTTLSPRHIYTLPSYIESAKVDQAVKVLAFGFIRLRQAPGTLVLGPSSAVINFIFHPPMLPPATGSAVTSTDDSAADESLVRTPSGQKHSPAALHSGHLLCHRHSIYGASIPIDLPCAMTATQNSTHSNISQVYTPCLNITPLTQTQRYFVSAGQTQQL